MRIPAALAALSLLVPSALPASPAVAADTPADAVVAAHLTPEHRAALQCAAVFAIVASEQANGAPAALAFPPLAVRGKRYFVEVSTRVVGDFVLAELVELDALAAARFASVFQDFESAQDYEDFFASIKRGPP